MQTPPGCRPPWMEAPPLDADPCWMQTPPWMQAPVDVDPWMQNPGSCDLWCMLGSVPSPPVNRMTHWCKTLPCPKRCLRAVTRKRPVGCVPPACRIVYFSSYQMSALVDILKWISLNRFPVLPTKMSLAVRVGLGGGFCTVKSHVGRGGSLYGEVQCIMCNGHMGPPVNRQTGTTENITFP